jgi:RimJ/RimL family protein N-acetyltransferase
LVQEDGVSGNMNNIFTIDCGKIFLREFIIEDAEKIYEFAKEEDISKFLLDWKTSKEQRLEWVRDYEIQWNKEFLQAASTYSIKDQMLKMGVVLKKTDEFIGWCCTCIKSELPPPNREINYAITKRYCRNGYATKAVSGLTEYLFEHTNIDHLIILADPENIASNRVIQKSGFRFQRDIVMNNEIRNYSELSKEDWMNMKQELHISV